MSKSHYTYNKLLPNPFNRKHRHILYIHTFTFLLLCRGKKTTVHCNATYTSYNEIAIATHCTVFKHLEKWAKVSACSNISYLLKMFSITVFSVHIVCGYVLFRHTVILCRFALCWTVSGLEMLESALQFSLFKPHPCCAVWNLHLIWLGMF